MIIRYPYAIYNHKKFVRRFVNTNPDGFSSSDKSFKMERPVLSNSINIFFTFKQAERQNKLECLSIIIIFGVVKYKQD